MRIYEATLYERPKYGETMPVMVDGQPVSSEFTAETASKARYQFFLDLRDPIPDVRFQDIRVRSLSKESPRPKSREGWEQRLEKANQIIRVIGSHGRHFLSENSDRHRDLIAEPFFTSFFMDKRNELWFVDRYTRKPILVRHQEWRGFSDGGTLRDLIKHLASYIWENKMVHMPSFGPWPDWICGGDLWGYGFEEMQKVRDGIKNILDT